MSENQIQFKKLHENATIPSRSTPNSAGFDLYALEDTIIIGGGGNVLVPTGIAVQLPEGTYGRIAMRSGLAVKQHLGVSAGVIDIDYTGGIGVVVFCSKIFDTSNILTQNIFTQITDDVHLRQAERVGVKVEYWKEDYDLSKSTELSNLMDCYGNLLIPSVSPHFYVIKKGEKFAQLIPEKVSYATSQIVNEFNRTYSQHLGYGSTGNGLKSER